MRITKIQLEEKLSECESENRKLNNLLETNEKQFQEKIEKISEEKDNTITEQEEEIEELKEKIDIKESKKLAESYKEQEGIYKEDAVGWLKALVISVCVLIISTGAAIYFSYGKPWYQNVEYYFLDFIFISVVWFCASNYNDLVKLRYDYANRRTLAQSFHNILNNLAEDKDIKTKFIEKTTDVLCAPNVVTIKEPVLSKKILKGVTEILKIAKNE